MTVRFDAARHLYYVDDELVPNVTRMIAALGLIDTSHFTEEARQRGSHVHQAVHYWIEGALDWDSVHESYRGHVEAAVRYLEDTGVEKSALRTEVRVYHAILRYCGTADVLWPIAAEKVSDWKSGDYGEGIGVQTALYDMADPLPNGRRRRREGVRLGANGKYRVLDIDRERDPDGHDYHYAKAIVSLYHRFHWKREQKELMRAA